MTFFFFESKHCTFLPVGEDFSENGLLVEDEEGEKVNDDGRDEQRRAHAEEGGQNGAP